MILSTVLSVLSNERILFFRLSELKIFICLSISILHCFSLRAGITGIPFGLFFTVRQPTVINELKRITDMDYRTLTSGGLLRLAREKGMSLPEQEAAYTEFSEQIFAVYTGGGSPRHLHFTLAFAEAELCAVSQYAGGRASPCVEKALSLVRHLLDGVKTQVPPLSSIPFKDEKKDDTPADALLMRWTGNLSDFVEMVYGLDSLKCINGGETGVTELLLGFGKLLGLKLKDKQCYNAYADIKRRKSDSRTYFFDKAAEKLNRRMQEDEERERMRKR